MCKWGISWELLALMLISATEVTRVLFLLHAYVFKIWQEVLGGKVGVLTWAYEQKENQS